MSAIRTQIYLSEEQRRKIDAVAASEGVTMAEVVRRALDSYLTDETDVEAALAGTFGADPDASPPSRDEWDRG
jgi:predicted DNA-binding protein